MAETKCDVSEAFWKFGLCDAVVRKRATVQDAKGARSDVLAPIRQAAENDGKPLLPGDNGFSKHGSLYQCLHFGDKLNDIDVYVVFDGTNVTWNNLSMIGESKQPNFTYPLAATTARNWMVGIVEQCFHIDVDLTKRGASFTLDEQKYDLIPAFSYLDDDRKRCHVIPNEEQWESNPTEADNAKVVEFDKKYGRNQETKQLGYRDIVKLCKRLSFDFNWKGLNGVSSFMIRTAVDELCSDLHSKFNQKNVEGAVCILNRWIDAKFFHDPNTQQRTNLEGKVKNISYHEATILQHIRALTEIAKSGEKLSAYDADIRQLHGYSSDEGC